MLKTGGREGEGLAEDKYAERGWKFSEIRRSTCLKELQFFKRASLEGERFGSKLSNAI